MGNFLHPNDVLNVKDVAIPAYKLHLTIELVDTDGQVIPNIIADPVVQDNSYVGSP
jgi:hypothetical protein